MMIFRAILIGSVGAIAANVASAATPANYACPEETGLPANVECVEPLYPVGEAIFGRGVTLKGASDGFTLDVMVTGPECLLTLHSPMLVLASVGDAAGDGVIGKALGAYHQKYQLAAATFKTTEVLGADDACNFIDKKSKVLHGRITYKGDAPEAAK